MFFFPLMGKRRSPEAYSIFKDLLSVANSIVRSLAEAADKITLYNVQHMKSIQEKDENSNFGP